MQQLMLRRRLTDANQFCPHLKPSPSGTAELQRRLRLLRHHPAPLGSGGCLLLLLLLLLVLHHLNQLLILPRRAKVHTASRKPSRL